MILGDMTFFNDTSILPELAQHATSVKLFRYPWLAHPVVVAFVIISLVGNIFIFALVCLSTTFRRPSNYLIANLCAASVYFICVFNFYNVRTGEVVRLWEYNSLICSIVGVAQRLAAPVLPYTIMAISLDRSKAARDPLNYASTRTILIQILAIWTLSLVIVFPRSMIAQYDPNIPTWYKCKKVPLGGSAYLQTAYACLVLIFVYLIPTYILIKEFITLRSKMKFLTLSQVEQKKRLRHRLRLMQNSCIFTGIFILCWLPQGIFQFPFDLPSELSSKVVDLIPSLEVITDLSRQIVMINTCLNPILLLLLSFDVREYLATCSFI